MTSSTETEAWTASLAKKERELQQAAVFLRTALNTLAQRTMTLLALIAGAAMFGAAVWDPSGWRIAAACLFAVLVFCPLAWIDARRDS